MNKKPVSYMQTDPRWSGKDYSAPGEKTTIGKAGCGPASAAMLIETLTGKPTTPADTAAWALRNGYKALNQGTYYAYFAAQFKAHGIVCKQLNAVSAYGKPNDPIHNEAFNALKNGYYLIVCMGKGLWTSSGHYVVVWWQDGKVHILDPASTAANRTTGDLATFKSQVKYYWAIDARNYNAGGNPAPVTRPTLRKGAKGEDVKDLQRALGRAGFALAIDGDFGRLTEVAVLAFQRAKGLAADCVVGAKTWAALGV